MLPSAVSVQQALQLLKPGGLIFAEMIGERHHLEVAETLTRGPRRLMTSSMLDQARVAFERNGVEVRIAADLLSKWCYPDIYEWLHSQCDIWAWAGGQLPDLVDEQQLQAIEHFAQRNTSAKGEVETTHHVIWIGDVKVEPPGWEPVLVAPGAQPAA